MTQGKDRSASAVLEVSRKIYETSLGLYPDDLRKEFGDEMVEVFEEQVTDAYTERGLPGLLRVWFCAAREFVSIALTGQIAERMVPILAVGTAFALMLWLAGFMAPATTVVDKACGH